MNKLIPPNVIYLCCCNTLLLNHIGLLLCRPLMTSVSDRIQPVSFCKLTYVNIVKKYRFYSIKYLNSLEFCPMASLTDGKSFNIRYCFISETNFIKDSPALTMFAALTCIS